MTNEQNPIDELFRNGLKDGGLTPPSGVWEAVSAGLPAAAPTGLISVVVKSVWTWVVSGCILVGGLVAVFSSEKQEPSAVVEQTAKTPSAELSAKTDAANQNMQISQGEEAKVQQSIPLIPANSERSQPSEMTAQSDLVSAEVSADGNEQTVQPADEVKNVGSLLVEEHSANSIPVCGRLLKVTAVKAGGDNNWSFNMPAVPAGAHCSWLFGDGEKGTGNPVQHQYADVNAEYEVKVLVFRSASCMDSGVYRVVTRQLHKGLSIPDVITPNGDGLNDELVITLPESVQFNMIVTDKNGKQVFTSNNPAHRWNGKSASEDCPSGTYRVFVTYKTTTAKQPVTYTKSVILNR